VIQKMEIRISSRMIAGSTMTKTCARFTLALLVALMICRTDSGQLQTSGKPSEVFQSAEALVRQGRLDEARTQVLDKLQQNPDSVEGYNLLGVIESEKQDYPNALSAFQKALQLAPNSTKAHNNLGSLYLAQKKLDLAEKEFRTVLRLDHGNQEGNYNLGLLLLTKGSPAEAIPLFERVHPQNIETRLNLIRANLRVKHTTEALRLATQLSDENKNDVQLHFTLGLLLSSEMQYKAAQVELEKADVVKPDSFEILDNLAQTEIRAEEYAQAEPVLNRALKLKPESAEALYLLAQVYANELRPLEALDLLVRARKLEPRNPDILFLMAQISISQKYFEDAIPLLEEALQIDSKRTDIRSALGESYFKSDKIDKAIEQFKQVIAVAPSVRAYAVLGLSHTYFGRFDEAKQDFENGLKLDPHDNFCKFHLGYIAEQQGDSATAEAAFQQVLHSDPDFPYALLELANLRIEKKRLPEAAELLRKYVRVSSSPASGYYKLAMIERSLHDSTAADKDLVEFQTLSKSDPVKSHPYEHLFDYIDGRSQLAAPAREQRDLDELVDQAKKHPDQPEILYLLAEAYLKSGKVEQARSTIAQLDKTAPGDFRAIAGAGALLARYRLYRDAIQQFQLALQIKPGSDDVNFDLANSYFREGMYTQALDVSSQISEQGRKDDSYLSLLADIYAHQGDTARAAEIFQSAIKRNPDNDQDYLSLALLQFRESHFSDAKQTLLNGQARMPGSGKILWGLGLASAMEGNTGEAARQLESAVDILPEWPGSYSTLGVFYFQTGQIDKAKEVLNRFKSSNANSGLDISKIEQVLAQSSAAPSASSEPMTPAQSRQFLQLALFFADKTL
jgi:tetratricopeptide (TPR) repeat protein